MKLWSKAALMMIKKRYLGASKIPIKERFRHQTTDINYKWHEKST